MRKVRQNGAVVLGTSAATAETSYTRSVAIQGDFSR